MSRERGFYFLKGLQKADRAWEQRVAERVSGGSRDRSCLPGEGARCILYSLYKGPLPQLTRSPPEVSFHVFFFLLF